MSNQYHQKSFSVIAVTSVTDNHNNHIIERGLVFPDPLRSKIVKAHSLQDIHASLIEIVIKDLPDISKIIVCCDVKPTEKVMARLGILRPGLFGRIKSIDELREDTGLRTFKSAADGFAKKIERNYLRQKNVHRQKTYFDNVCIVDETHSLEYNRLQGNLEQLRLAEIKNSGNDFSQSNR